MKPMNQHTEEIKNLSDLKKIAKSLARRLKIPQLVLLEGPVGAGKTRLVQYMAEAWGCPKGEVRSPTFSIVNVYGRTGGGDVFHTDLYRLSKSEDIENTGIWDIFYSPALVFMEWPGIIKNQLPLFWNKLEIEINFVSSSKSRTLTWREQCAIDQKQSSSSSEEA